MTQSVTTALHESIMRMGTAAAAYGGLMIVQRLWKDKSTLIIIITIIFYLFPSCVSVEKIGLWWFGWAALRRGHRRVYVFLTFLFFSLWFWQAAGPEGELLIWLLSQERKVFVKMYFFFQGDLFWTCLGTFCGKGSMLCCVCRVQESRHTPTVIEIVGLFFSSSSFFL